MTDALRVQYSQLMGTQGEVILRPLLSLKLNLDDANIQVTGLLDSGADINILP